MDETKVLDASQTTVNRAMPYEPDVRGSGSLSGLNRGSAFDDLFGNTMLTGIGMDMMPPYWSKDRDKYLRDWVQSIDILSLASYTFVSKASTVEMLVKPDDGLSKADAETIYDIMFSGFEIEFSKFIQDFITQDNGAFMALLGDSVMVQGEDDRERPGFIKPQSIGNGLSIGVTGFKALDSQKCQRTGDEIWPVIYKADEGNYLLHYSRVIMMADMPNPDPDMNGVGFCGASRCATAAEYLNNIAIKEGESMGSRPLVRILYAASGMTYETFKASLAEWNASLNNQALSRYSKTLVLAKKTLAGEPLELNTLDLSDPLPTNIEKEVYRATMIAAAFGLTLRDLGLAGLLSGQTRADAEVQQEVGRSKGVGQFLLDFAKQLNFKAMPENMPVEFDTTDATDEINRSNLRESISQRQDRDLTNGVIDERSARLELLQRGFMSDAEFARLEALSGRDIEGFPIDTSEYSRITGRTLVIQTDEQEDEPDDDTPDVNATDTA